LTLMIPYQVIRAGEMRQNEAASLPGANFRFSTTCPPRPGTVRWKLHESWKEALCPAFPGSTAAR